MSANRKHKISETINARDERRKAIALYVNHMPHQPRDHWDMLTMMIKDLSEMRDELRA